MIEQERLTPTEEAKWLAEKGLGVRQCTAVSRAGKASSQAGNDLAQGER